MERERATKRLLICSLLCFCLSSCASLGAVAGDSSSGGGGDSDPEPKALLVLLFAAWVVWDEFWRGEEVADPDLPPPSVVAEEPK